MKGIAPILELKVSEKGEFISGKIIPIKQINGGFSIEDPEKLATKKIKELTDLNFPNHSLIINDSGYITTK